MDYTSFWYVVAESSELGSTTVVRRKLLGEWLAVFRDDCGQASVLRDRCMHRSAPLSQGSVVDGRLRCPYHGWTYDGQGVVRAVPAEGSNFRASKRRCAKRYEVIEQHGFVYARLDSESAPDIKPFEMPHRDDPDWQHLCLVNTFRNNVTNCAENFIDIPHTVFVHPGIFRTAREQRIEAQIERSEGSVRVSYKGETDNVGWFRRFLNPGGVPLVHRDNFHMPNVTEVEYRFSENRSLYIISQSVPEEENSTRVYTTLSYNFGIFSRNALLRAVTSRVLAYQGQAVIDQDLVALEQQMRVLEKYGEEFNNTSADAIHVFVESIRDALVAGKDPRLLAHKTANVSFVV